MKTLGPAGDNPPVPRPLPRAVDLLLALSATLVTAPLLAAAALLVLLLDGRPVVYTQERIGRGGRPFRFRKLRTMRVSAGGPGVTAAGDARITPVGRFLRRTKLDELPNFWGIVAGDLALVGPRAEVPRYVDLSDPRWQRVLAVRPGLADEVTLRLLDEERLLAEAGGDGEAFYREVLLPWKLAESIAAEERRTPLGDLGVLVRAILAPIRRPPQLTLEELLRGAADRPPVSAA